VQATDANTILDLSQLRDITMDDADLMREILAALLADTSQQMCLLEAAIRAENTAQCMRLAHYSKGACANVGANRAAGMFKQIESKAADGAFSECGESLASLVREMDLLRNESAAL
jgi:HPt (histidine-containing phosphotransfer) domain-containing protein